ncbi:MAG TPA: DUF4331 family protein [Candidatus Lustribacter sp.]|jgi:hypothetical protein|nr:DUF4331 family protein [Candidatus Lustribacter sp.]
MKHIHRLLTAAALGLGLTACGGGSSSNVTVPVQGSSFATKYTQIELLSRPAVKELFEKFVDHQITNAAEPYADPTLQGEIQGFTDALRPPSATLGSDYGKVLAAVLYPNWITADLSQTGGAAYLGNETGGATSATKSTFGGRAITDDVIAISLGAVFGHTLPALGLQPEDNEENNCISNDNTPQRASQTPSGAFPYLAAPH